MDNPAAMGVLQSRRDLFDIGRDHRWLQDATFRIALSQRASRCIIQHKIRHIVIYTEIQDAHYMGMRERSNQPRLAQKLLHVLLIEPHLEHFHSGLRIEVNMHREIDAGEAAASNLPHNSIMTKNLSSAINHRCQSLRRECITISYAGSTRRQEVFGRQEKGTGRQFPTCSFAKVLCLASRANEISHRWHISGIAGESQAA